MLGRLPSGCVLISSPHHSLIPSKLFSTRRRRAPTPLAPHSLYMLIYRKILYLACRPTTRYYLNLLPLACQPDYLSIPSIIEQLPLELRINILGQMSDLGTLSALVHASPSFHDAYVAMRKELLPLITWRTLKNRGIDVLKETPASEIVVSKSGQKFLKGNHTLYLETLINICRSQVRHGPPFENTTPDEMISLTVSTSPFDIRDLFLLTLRDRPSSRGPGIERFTS